MVGPNVCRETAIERETPLSKRQIHENGTRVFKLIFEMVGEAANDLIEEHSVYILNEKLEGVRSIIPKGERGSDVSTRKSSI